MGDDSHHNSAEYVNAKWWGDRFRKAEAFSEEKITDFVRELALILHTSLQCHRWCELYPNSAILRRALLDARINPNAVRLLPASAQTVVYKSGRVVARLHFGCNTETLREPDSVAA